MRVLIDSNVYISALAFGGTPLNALLKTSAAPCEIIVSSYIAGEVRKSLSSKFKWPQARIEEAVREFFSRALFIEPALIRPLVRDPKDNPVLACALAGGADYLITGDKDLLVLKRHGSLCIIKPKDFINLY